MTTLRVGVIGLGRAGRVHLDAWRAVDGAEAVAVADVDAEACQAAQAAGVRAYADPEALLAGEALDAVSVCTPPASHAAIATACLEHGVDVLCEKPLALGATEAGRMFATAARYGRRLVLATKFRHVAGVARARAFVADGALGEPLTFAIEFSSVVDMAQRWNADGEVAGGGVVADNGTHAFDLVAHLFGRVARVHATQLKAARPLDVEDAATILVAAERGLVGRIELSWSFAGGPVPYLTIHGSQGSIDVGWDGAWLRRLGRSPVPIAPAYDRDDAHRRMLAAFRDVARGRARPWVAPDECIRTQAAIEATYRSMHSGDWAPVEVPPFVRVPRYDREALHA
jgi:predicted dehydrogenase